MKTYLLERQEIICNNNIVYKLILLRPHYFEPHIVLIVSFLLIMIYQVSGTYLDVIRPPLKVLRPECLDLDLDG